MPTTKADARYEYVNTSRNNVPFAPTCVTLFSERATYHQRCHASRIDKAVLYAFLPYLAVQLFGIEIWTN